MGKGTNGEKLGKFVALTGVSGSGKSTLLLNTLYPALMRALYNSKIETASHDIITGMENVDKVVDIDQSPIGRSPRSNPATYTGVFGDIRDFYAGLPESKARGYTSGRFSFNVKGGRCESCKGDGVKKTPYRAPFPVTQTDAQGREHEQHLDGQYLGGETPHDLEIHSDASYAKMSLSWRSALTYWRLSMTYVL